MKTKLLSNTIYLYILNIAKMGFALISLPYLTRILSIDAYASVAYVKSYMQYVQLLLDFGFLLSATKSIAIAKDKDNEKIGYITGNTLAEKFILLILAAVITLIISSILPLLRENLAFTWLYFISIGITVLLPDFLYRGIEKMAYVTIPYAVAKTVSLILTLILIKNDGDILLIPIFEIISSTVAVLISFIFLKKLNIRIRFNKIKVWMCDLKESAVYFASHLAETVFGALTTLIVGILLDEKNIAFWSVCMLIVSTAKSLYAPIINSLYPYMVTNNDIKLLNKIAYLMSIPMVFGSVTVILFGENIMALLGGANYAEAGYVLKLLLPVIISSFYSMLYGWTVLGAIGKVRETTISTVIAAGVQIVGILVIYLLGIFNLTSLALCCGISEILLFVIRYSIFLKSQKSI